MLSPSTLEGFVDDVPFDGGKDTEYPLTLGSNTFIPGFEDQLVGVKAGDHVRSKSYFPGGIPGTGSCRKKKQYLNATLRKWKQKSSLNWTTILAQDVSEFDTLAEYKEDLKKKLAERKEKEALRAKEDAAVDKVIENAQMDIPEAMIRTQGKPDGRRLQ